MRALFAFALALCTVIWLAEDVAALTVNPAQPITKQVSVQIIQTALDNGTTPATVFGNAVQTAAIEADIDLVWVQAGIDINFLPTVNRFNSTFAYQGNAGSGVRPQGDLGTIVANARAAGVLNPDPQVIDMFLLNVVPAFAPLDEAHVAGLSYISGNGVTGFVGDNLLAWGAFDTVAGVFAHEIGHNLGLNHVSDTTNLMNPTPSSQKLDASQIAIARASTFARAFATPIVVGDYNGNGIVDQADYVVWRNTLNQTGVGLAADGNANGLIDAGDYSVWRSHLGNRSGSGAGTSLVDSSAPEPSMAVYVLSLVFLSAARRVRK
jgi:hypothetical protein